MSLVGAVVSMALTSFRAVIGAALGFEAVSGPWWRSNGSSDDDSDGFDDVGGGE